MITRPWREEDRDWNKEPKGSYIVPYIILWVVIEMMVFVMRAAAQTPTPVGGIAFSVSCLQAVEGDPNLAAYSGDSAIYQAQWGHLDFVPSLAQGSIINGIGVNTTGICPLAVIVTGDCHQSVTSLTASNGIKKWVISPGAPPECGTSGLSAWKWTAGASRWSGFIPDATINRLGTCVLQTDTAYCPAFPSGFDVFDLNGLTMTGHVATAPSGEGRQNGINGVKWNVMLSSNPDGKHFIGYPVGAVSTPTPTPTPPGPTPTPGPNQFQDWIYQVAAEKLIVGCSPTLYCPGDNTLTWQGLVTRAQQAVYMLKAEHGASYVPPPCAPPGKFTDVRCVH